MGEPRSVPTLRLLLILLLAAVAWSGAATPTQDDDAVVSAIFSTTGKLYRMAVDKSTGKIYVGATNSVYQLAANLSLERKAELGPYADSSECAPRNACLPNQNRSRDYHTKAMAIDYSMKSLIVCGSRSQGTCTLHSLQDVSKFRTPSNESVVSPNINSSTVLFISNGPGPHHQVLYVGTGWTNGEPYQSDVPTVASRSLDPNNNTFSIAVRGETLGTRIFVNSLARPSFPINYVFGFDFRGFSYWLTVQKRSVAPDAQFISKLVRVCQNDPDYNSYTEVELICRSAEGVHYNLAQAGFVIKPGSDLAGSLDSDDEALFVVFAKSENGTLSRPGNQSALCVFPLELVMRNFTENIRHCFRGQGSRGLDFITPSTPCVNSPVSITDIFCGLDVNTPLDGAKPITAWSVITYSDTQLTSVAAVGVYNYTLAFLGTREGHLKKVRLEPATGGFEVYDIVVDEGRPINKDMQFDRNAENVYVMTHNKVSIVKVQQCSRYKTCTTCNANKDPHCGWCGQERKCSLRADCEKAAVDPDYWNSYKNECSAISHILPSQAQRTTIRNLNLKIENKTFIEDKDLVCVFATSGFEAETNATRTTDGITCSTPDPDILSPISAHKNNFTVKLSLGSKKTPEYFTFYDCSAYETCTECTSTPYACSWCTDGHRCTHNVSENCRNDFIVTSLGTGPSIREGPDFCPRIRKSPSSANEIIVPKGATLGIRIQVENLAAHMVQSRFVCQFNSEGRVKQVNAQLLGDSVYCGRIPFTYSSEEANVTARFGVIWESRKLLDNPENIHVVVYDCSKMATGCGDCHAVQEKYGCGWCSEAKTCQVRSDCLNWIDRSQVCPDPEITQFQPETGPIEGGTNLTIEGERLGNYFEDIEAGVHVSLEADDGPPVNVPCIPYKDLYVKSRRIVCNMQRPGIDTPIRSGPIVVTVRDQFSTKSGENYTFVDPSLSSVTPEQGPKSGGTDITIRGARLNTGSTAEVSVGGVPCEVTKRSDFLLTCKTSKAPMTGPGRLVIKIDDGRRELENYTYSFVEDPEIDNVESGTGGSQARGIASGGLTVHFKGRHLDVVQEPAMYVTAGGQRYSGKCIPESPDHLKCRSPAVPKGKLTFGEDPSVPLEMEYGVRMDGVHSVLDLVKNRGFKPFQMFTDPVYVPFPEDVKEFKSDYLTITGENLDLASDENEVVVRIGTDYCNVTSLSRRQLTCRPPNVQPAGLDTNGHPDREILPDVVVHVGDQLSFVLGKLNYTNPQMALRTGMDLGTHNNASTDVSKQVAE